MSSPLAQDTLAPTVDATVASVAEVTPKTTPPLDENKEDTSPKAPRGTKRAASPSKGGDAKREASRTDRRLSRKFVESPRPESLGPAEARLPKRKVAMLMGFCGTGYQGMQVNPGAKTIESDLFDALVKTGAVSKDNSDDIRKVGFMRAARTDKGVHAAGQVVSLKLITDLPNLVETINSHLPDQIRIWGYVQTIKSFHSKNQCDSRIYEYLLPTYTLQPMDTTMYDLSVPAAQRPLHYSTAEEMAKKRAFRITPELLAKVREGLAQYIGTWSYHNFTLGKAYGDMSAKRYIMSFTASEPKILADGTEWLSLKVHGQSFMIHQIRKMVGLIICLLRTDTPMSVVMAAFTKVKLNIPKAPGVGLLLEQPIFAQYNTRMSGAMGAAIREPIDFSIHEEKMDTFKEKFIYDKIVAEELQHNSFDQWVQSVDSHIDNYPYLNPEGDVTAVAPEIAGPTDKATESDEEDQAADNQDD